ncbi:MAG: hypothetical protein KDA37_10850, partial [Planctomycetales bacterium]|nr:hypothetical protein [Planctomycetales bacterium]
MKSWSVAWACVALMVPASGADAQINLPISNSGFETGAQGDAPSGWTPETNSLWIGSTSIGGADPGG